MLTSSPATRLRLLSTSLAVGLACGCAPVVKEAPAPTPTLPATSEQSVAQPPPELPAGLERAHAQDAGVTFGLPRGWLVLDLAHPEPETASVVARKLEVSVEDLPDALGPATLMVAVSDADDSASVTLTELPIGTSLEDMRTALTDTGATIKDHEEVQTPLGEATVVGYTMPADEDVLAHGRIANIALQEGAVQLTTTSNDAATTASLTKNALATLARDPQAADHDH